MENIINARGLDCPQPVILTKKAIEKSDLVKVVVDNEIARENVSRLAEKSGFSVGCEVVGAEIHLTLKKKDSSLEKDSIIPESFRETSGPEICVISSHIMGGGDDELGEALLKMFIHTLSELDRLPQSFVFYNSGVKLAAHDSDVIEDLKAFEKKGVQLLICGTCVNFYNIKEKMGVGQISNMYDIASLLSTAGKIIKP